MSNISTRCTQQASSRYGRRIVVVALLLVAVVKTAPAAAEADPSEDVLRFRGVASDESGAVVYTEQHEVFYRDGRIQSAQTRYIDPNGRLIGTLESDYSQSKYAPAYTFEDHRVGKIEGLRYEGEDIVMFRKRDLSGELEEKRLDPRDDHVGGQGFNQLVMDRLRDLRAGKEVEFDFLIPDRLDDYSLRVKTESERDHSDVVHLECELSSWFLRLLAPSLKIKYDAQDGRLVSYEGNSNLASADGDAMLVRIDYEYDEADELAATDEIVRSSERSN